MDNVVPDLLVAICSHRTIAAPTCHSLDKLRLASQAGNLGINYQVGLFVGDALISRCRSQACTKFLEETKSPYMIFVDDDIIFEPADIQKIYQHLASQKYDIIGGIYPVRGAGQLSSYGWDGKLDVDGEVKEIEFLATGFMGISRRALMKVKEEFTYADGTKMFLCNPNDWSRCFPFFEAKAVTAEERARGGDPIYISEDWDFVQKARKVGIQCYADTSVQVGHLREEIFTVNAVRQNQLEQIHHKMVYGPMEAHAVLMRSIDTDLSQFLNMPLPKIQAKMQQGQATVAEDWKTHTGSTDDFYRNNENYLFDLAVFNQQPSYFQDRLGQLVNIKGLKILDIGCGIGTVVFGMGEQGNEVTGWDINKRAIDFCEFKKQKYNLKGTFTTEKPDFSQFDFIIAVDVLEHIENLEAFITDLAAGMKKGTKFYHSDYFPRGEAWPMHFEDNEKILKDLLNRVSLIVWDARWAIKG